MQRLVEVINKVHMPNKRFVSKYRYIAAKMQAVVLSSGAFLCVAGVVLIFLSLPYCAFLDKQGYHQWLMYKPDDDIDHYCMTTYSWLAQLAAMYLLLPLFISVCAFRWGASKSWKTVRAMQPIHYADAGHLPAAGSLVRASQEPAQAQETVLLRASTAGQEKHTEQLLRAATGVQE